MSVPRPVEHDLGNLRDLHLRDLRATAEAAVGSTEAGAFRAGFYGPGIVRLQIGRSGLPDYGLLVGEPDPPATVVEQAEGRVGLRDGDLLLAVDPAEFTVTLRRAGVTLLGPPHDAHFGRRYRLPRFATTATGFCVAIDLVEGEPVYGHGEKWSRLDHRGQQLVSWNEDALGVNAELSYKNCPFAWSPRGWGIFANTTGKVVHGVGYAPWSHRSYVLDVEDNALDLFLIAGTDPAAILERYTWLTGRPAAVPRWSLGAWLSKAYYHDADELLAAATKVRASGLPMDVITLDGRAWLETSTRFAFEWDKTRYPDPRPVIDAVRERGLRLCLWEYPLVSVHHPGFAELARKGWFLRDAGTGKPWLQRWDQAPFGPVLTPLPTSALIDFTHPGAYAWWCEQHGTLFAQGVAVMKTDFGEQVPADGIIAHNGDRGAHLHNAYALLYNRCVFEASRRHHGTGLVFARSGWAGSQRYPGMWGGDPQSDWGGLAASIRGMLSWAASGVPFYATDIGGFYGEQPVSELFVRWCQAAVFASHMRFHGLGAREPWSFDAWALPPIRRALELRYRLIPYIEEHLAAATRTGLPLTRPMSLAFPESRESHGFDTQYMFGPDLLVAPILLPGGVVSVWLPEGLWWEWDGRRRHRGPKRLDLELPIDRFPLFARDGAVIPLAVPVDHVDAWGQGPIPIDEVRRFS